MPKKKISPINEEFDVKLLITIGRKNSIALALIILVSAISSFLIIRYTPPVYESTSILQLSMENEAKGILNPVTLQQFQDESKILASSIELIRSKVMVGRALSRLPMEVSYYNKGDILTYELYKSSPYQVEFDKPDSAMFERPIFIEFNRADNYNLRYTGPSGDNILKNNLAAGTWQQIPGMRIKIEVTDSLVIYNMKGNLSKDALFFKINSPAQLVTDVIKNLKVLALNPQAYTIQISIKDGNNLRAADISNALANEFKNYDLEKNSEVADKILTFINNTISGIDENLKMSEQEIEQFQRENKLIDADETGSKVMNELDVLQTETYNLKKDIFILQNVMSEISNETDIGAFIMSVSGMFNNPAIAEQLRTMQRLLEDRNQIRLSSTEKSDAYKNLELKLSSQKNLLQNMLSNESAKLKSQLNYSESELFKKQQQLGRIPGQQAEASRLKRVFSINEKFYSLLLEKKAEFSITKAGYVPQHIILEEAKLSTVPISPKKPLIISASLTIGFILGFLLILVKYLLYNEINSLEEVGLYTDAALLGIVPKYKRDIPISQLLVDKNPKSIISESFRSIRTNLQFISYGQGAKLVAVTSTISGEGKTFNAINLAGVIAFSGKKVVILDLDMRKPKIHLGFNVENNHGMSTLLIGKDKPENCITKSSLANLDFITAGPIPPNPAELIISPKMEELIEYLKGLYEIIIIDLPPVGIVSDGVPMLKRADYPIYILRANFSRKMFINQINKLIHENKVNNLSVILNGVEMSRIKYGYGYGYSYGYGYGYGYSYGYGYYEDDEAPRTFLGWIGSKFSPKKPKA
jgi:capsular exopolysaccharide synthesis family protein